MKGIRIEVPYDIYEKLQTEQEKRRLKSGKKPALASLILEFTSQKLDEIKDVPDSVQGVQPNEQNSGIQKPQQVQAIPLIDPNTEKYYKQWESRLTVWENSLSNRDRALKSDECDVYEKKDELLEMREGLLNKQEEMQKKSVITTEMIVENSMLKKDIEYKTEKNAGLEKQLDFIKKSVQNNLDSIQKKVSEETKKPNWMEKLMDGLPWLLAGGSAGALITYFTSKGQNKQNEFEKLPPPVQKIAKFLENVAEGDHDKLVNLMLQNAKLLTEPAAENKNIKK
jgi:hypothetical protein